MSNKRNYWLKLKENFFEQDEIMLVEDMDNGKDYIIFYMKLVLRSINSNGELRFKDTIPYNEKMLATITRTNVDIVKGAIDIFLKLGMMERWDDGTLFMIETQNMIGSESSSAARVRKHRERQSQIENKPEALHSNTDVTDGNDSATNSNIDIDTDIEKEKEEDTEKNKKEDKDSKKVLIQRLVDAGAEPETADDFYRYRIKRSRPLSSRSVSRVINQVALVPNYSMEDALDLTMAKTWITFEAEYVQGKQPVSKGSSKNSSVVQNAMDRYK